MATAGEVVHVIVMAGQSNMVGAGNVDLLPEHLQPWADPLPAIPCRQWLNGSEYGPVGWTDHLRPRGVFIGPEMSFGHRIAAARPNESVAILKMAYNGTNLGCSWNADGCGEHLYETLVNIIEDWMEDLESTGVDCRLAGVVWVQGESDSRSNWAAKSYFNNLLEFVRNLRIDTRRATLPFVLVRVHPRASAYQYGPQVRAAMRNLAAIDTAIDSVGISDLALKSDNIHLTADSMVRTGIRAADAILALGCLDSVEDAPDCLGDFDGDDHLGVSDLLQLLEFWGPCGP
ncbi:MAG: sialate O-acetylesterase [Phycisphaerales bacterium]|nr:sialate O-acetylesterase [Phycisphaerales bacterium]